MRNAFHANVNVDFPLPKMSIKLYLKHVISLKYVMQSRIKEISQEISKALFVFGMSTFTCLKWRVENERIT